MKLNFKDLKQQKFAVDAEPTETVADVKAKVAAEKGFDAANVRLIWSGKILADANTIGSYEIKPTDQIVCMVQKPKAAPAAATAAAAAPKAPETPAPAAAQTPSAPAPAPSSGSAPAVAPATPTPAPATTATTQSPEAPRSGQDQSSMMLGAERQAAIANMESMGFERSQIERAMRAAFYNADRAVEYLLNGIPESAQSNVTQQPPAAQPPTSPPATAASTAATNPPTTAEPDEPVNLFEAAAAAAGNRGGARGAAGAGTGAAAPAAGAGAGTGAGTAAAAGALGAGGNLDFLRDNPTFRHLRQLVQQQPQMLENVLQTVGASNPQLAELISQHPDQFLQLLAEGGDGAEGEGEGGPPLPPGIQNVSVTTEERDAIERLCRLGFERDLVIQAYFACDKNEELAANFLFDNPDDEGDGQ